MNLEISYFVEADKFDETLLNKFVEFLLEKYQIDFKRLKLDFVHSFKDKNLKGFCMEYEPSLTYKIVVSTTGRNITQIFETIAHEFIHVKQYISDNLSFHLKTKNDIPYKNRWWEIEALCDAINLVKEFIGVYLK